MTSHRFILVVSVCALIFGFVLTRSRAPLAPTKVETPSHAKTESGSDGACAVGICEKPNLTFSFGAANSVLLNSDPADRAKVSSEKRSLRRLEHSMPDPRSARDQVGGAPHGAPRALLEFSFILGKRLETAVKSETAARELFPELETCALKSPSSSLASARGLCLVKAQELARRFPSLQRDFSDLSARADTESMRLARHLFE